ncbi:oxygen-independent coproporphyrinogen III oxidase [Termitidicoccus mucosus]|uniref:Coproporphyrinogen-III oxidase n=1 Tax=Termitidicoccus mucosus TaxID=1184151 RepID=A0A178IIT8_9BACT|nr:coproporphyrinogen III oxidase [Opitutaceae bacterium TSB47]
MPAVHQHPPVNHAPNLDLIRKYSMAAPRYTSYPPATRFTADLAPLDLDDAIRADNAPGAGPLSLYFHLPFCETRCWYCGCTTIITRRAGAASEYLDLLEREIALTAGRIDTGRPVVQLHLGGGTPTFLQPDEIRRLAAMVRSRFEYAPDAEISVEIDPRRLTRDHIRALAELGATRASLGVQDTDRRVQLAIHRHQPNALNQQAVAWLRSEGFRSINLDLIYGLPLQTRESFARTLDDVLTLGPDRLSVFSYAHVPWIKPAQKIFEDRGQLPDPEEKLAMFALAHERLTRAGFIDIGLDHFARPDDELARAQRAGTLHRNFQGYSTHAGASLYGFGLSSISQTADTYRQNTKDMIAYQAALAGGRLPVERGLRLDEEDRRRRAIIMRVMCERRLDYARLSDELGVDFEKAYAAELATFGDLIADGIVTMDDASLRVTPAGAPLLRVVAMRFDTTLPAAPARQHAKVI